MPQLDEYEITAGIAVVTILGSFILIFCGYENTAAPILALVIGYYFGAAKGGTPPPAAN